jgi:hypothetical protein
MQKIKIPIKIILLVLTLCSATVFAQSGTYFNQRDDQYRLLGLKRAKESFEVARAEYDRQKELFNRNLITQAELERVRSVFSDAEVNYQQSLLAVLFEQQFVSVTGAVKYHAQDGGRHVRLTLSNTSGGSAEFQKLLNIDDQLFRSLQPDVITSIYISLFNDQNAIISQPYEAKVDELRYGQPVTVDFTLLQDLDAVTVSIIYGNGSQRTMKIFLQKDVSVNKVAVQSEQFSQEIELGKTASYDLTLELFSGTGNTYSLEAVNLPQEISRYFKDPSTKARLSQVKFTESSTSKRAALEITMPDRPDGTIMIDQPLTFNVIAVPADRPIKAAELNGRTWQEEEINGLGVGYVKLELMPRGRGKLLVRSPQLYHSIDAGGTVEVTMELVNEGSRRIENAELRADIPLNWTKKIEPAVIPSLEIGAETRVKLTFQPPDDVSVGKYEIRVQSSAMSSGQTVTGEDKTITVEIRAGANILGTIILILLIAGLVATIVVFGIRLSKR